MARRSRAGKHTVYFELIEACRRGGCAICTMTQETVKRYLEAVIYESVNDPSTRDRVVAGRGYCNAHSWTLRELNAGLGVAMIYGDVLRHVAEDLQQRSPGSRPAIFNGRTRAGLRRRLAGLAGRSGSVGEATVDPHRDCPACAERDQYERLYLDTLLSHSDDEELRTAFRESGGLCLVHLDILLGVAGDEAALTTLLAVQQEAMLAVHAQLAEFIRKHDYRYRGEGIGAEGASWLRALELVAGKRGIR